MEGARALRQWWDRLTPDQREQAQHVGVGEAMPPWMVIGLTRHRPVVSCSWWPPSRSGARGHPMPAEVAQFVAEQADARQSR